MEEIRALELLVGPAGCGASAAARAEYRRVLRAADPLQARRRSLWLAPTHAAAALMRDSLVGGPGDAWIDPGVMTFAALAASVAWDAGLRVRLVSPLERRRLVRQVINEAAEAGELEFFRAAAAAAGLASLVDEAIVAWKRRGVTVAAAGGATSRRRELAALYRRYEARLAAAGLVDDEGLLLAARDSLEASPQAAADLELIVVDGFSDFTAAEHQVLSLLAGRAARTIVTLPGDAGGGRRDLFATAEAACAGLESLGGVRRDVPAARRAPTWPAMDHLSRNLFRDFAAIEPPSEEARASADRISIVAASSVQAEIEQIARRVKQLLVAGAAPGDVVVAFRSTRDVADRVRRAFDDYGVPLHLDAPRRLAATPLVRSLSAVLRLHAEDWPYRRMLQAAADRTMRVRPPSAAGEEELERRAVERCIREAQLPSGRSALLEYAADMSSELRVASSEDDPASAAAAAASSAAAHHWLASLAALLDELPSRAPLRSWIEHLDRLACALGLVRRAAVVADSGTAVEADRAWTALVNGLHAIDRLDHYTGRAGGELSLAELLDLLTTTAAELPAPDQRDATGRVRVASAEAARFFEPRHLFVGGLSEQSFPGGRVSADGDDDPAHARSGEMLLFYQLVTRPIETLSLSYPALDAKAQALPPSPLLVELERALGDAAPKRIEQPLAYTAPPEGPPLARSELRRSALDRALSRDRELLAAMIRSPRYGAVGESLLDGVEAVAERGRRNAFGAYEGLLLSEEVRERLARGYGPHYLWSPSLLETYAACPYRFFGEYVLHLAPPPELALESDVARRGSLLHDTLARLYEQVRAAGGPPPTPEAVAVQFAKTLDAVSAARPRRGLDAALREIERRQIAAWARRFAEQHREYAGAWQQLDQPLAPEHFEARFGPASRRRSTDGEASLSTDTPLVIAVGGEEFRFTGQIDRIDVGRIGETVVFNVIDYKTGARACVELDKVASGLQLQLPLYAIAAAELLLAEQNAQPLLSGYWSVRGKGFGIGGKKGPLPLGEIRSGAYHAADDWPDTRKAVEARIAEMVGGIRRGEFPVFNPDVRCGELCPLSTGCRVAHARSLEKAWPIEGAD